MEGAGEEQALGLGYKPSPHNPLTSPGVPGGARVERRTSGDEDKLGGTSEDELDGTSGDEDELDGTSGDEDELDGTSRDEDKLGGARGDTSGLVSTRDRKLPRHKILKLNITQENIYKYR